MVLTVCVSTLTAQSISGSLGTGTFVQGISPVTNTITITGAPGGTDQIDFVATDATFTTTYDSYTDNNAGDGFSWDVDMGQFPVGTIIWGEFYNSGSYNGNSPAMALTILPTPQWLVVGSVNNVTVNGNVVSFEGNYPIYNYPYTIPSSVKGIGGRSLDIVGSLIFNADFDMSNSTATVNDNRAQVAINLLDQLPSFSKDINFQTTCTLDNTVNLAFVITDEISTEPISVNMPKIKFPIGGILTVSVDAGISLYATLKGQLVIGQDQGQWGFIDQGGEKTKVIGVLTGEGFIRGEVSVLAGAASANASLKAKARLGIGFDYVSVPSSSFNPIVGGDLDVWGDVCYKTFWGLGPSKCKESPSFYYGMFGDTSAVRSALSSFDANFDVESITYRDTGTLVLPDFNPQPTFSTRGNNLYATWLEHDNNVGYLLFSKLNQAGTAFSSEIVVAQNDYSMSNPKIGILPSGSAIITWSQSRYNESTLPVSYDDEDLLQAQDVWFAIYDSNLDSITFSDKLGDDFSSLQSGRAEGEAKVSVGDDNDAIITWVSKDASTNSSDIWFSHLTETVNTWNLTTPAKLVDLSGTNSDVNVVYVDSASALAVWVNDPDGDEDTYDNDLIFSEWNGSSWSSQQTLSNNDGSTNFKNISLSSNNGYVAVAWTSSHYYSDNDFENRIDMEVYDAVAGDWDNASHFEDSDSLYYFQNPTVSISDNGIASICYQVTEMFPDTLFIDNGELYLYVKDLSTASNWTEITANTFLCDTNTYIWELTAGFAANDHYYTMTQEYNDNGVVTNPYHGVKFGDPDLSMVLRGLQVNSNLTVSDIQEPTSIPSGIKEIANRANFRLLNNYPNPFRQFTTIEFQLQDAAQVSLEVFNLTGVRVAQLLNTNLGAGIYKTQFSAGDLPAGIYFSKLTVDGRAATGKLVLTK